MHPVTRPVSLTSGAAVEYPYMRHKVHRKVTDLKFVPFEDVVGVGHADGFSSLLVPGCGEANFDSLEANPYQSKRQRREAEVKSLLEKIPADLITLNPGLITNKVFSYACPQLKVFFSSSGKLPLFLCSSGIETERAR